MASKPLTMPTSGAKTNRVLELFKRTVAAKYDVTSLINDSDLAERRNPTVQVRLHESARERKFTDDGTYSLAKVEEASPRTCSRYLQGGEHDAK